MYSFVCPFCNTVHERSNNITNIICGCGAKYYANRHYWLNRKTGEKVVRPKATCGCKKCKQWQTNNDETGFNCISFGFVVRILKNILECDSDILSSTQKESINIVIDIVKELDVMV